MQVERISSKERTEWLKARHQDVTASAVGALFGCHPYMTALELYLEKTTEEIEDVDNAVLRRGRILESAVAAAAAETKGWEPAKCEHYYRNPALRLGATPDYLINTTGLCPLQCKTVDPRVFERDWEPDSQPPLWIQLQVLTEAMLLDAPEGWVGALVLSRNYPDHYYRVERNAGAEARIIKAVEEFWARVGDKNMPSPDYARDSGAIAKLFPNDDGNMLDLTGDNFLPSLLDERSLLKAEVSEREARLKAIDAEIKNKLGPASGATLNGWKVTNKAQTRKEHVVAAATFRVLRVTDLRNKQEEAA